MPFCIGWVENFDEITLSCTVKKIEANFCFSVFGKNLKIQNGQNQLEGTGITTQDDSNTQVSAPSFTMVAGGKHCAQRSTIAPLTNALQIFTDASKEGWGAHLNERIARGSWSVPESKLHINYLELKAVFLALKEFQDLCVDKIVLVATDNTTVVSYINKEGGMRSGPLCALLWRILTWCTQRQVTLKA